MVGGLVGRLGEHNGCFCMGLLITGWPYGLAVGGYGRVGYPLRLGHRVNYKTGLFLEKGDGSQCGNESKPCLLLTPTVSASLSTSRTNQPA